MTINRRTFMTKTAVATAAIAAAGATTPDAAMATPPKTVVENSKPASTQDQPFVPNRIAVSTYSFFTFRDGSKLTMPQCIDAAAKMGFDGVELLLVQMKDTSDGFLQKLKRQAFVNGLDLCGMSTHQGFVTPDQEKRQRQVKLTISQIEMAYKLGIPTIRVNTGRWGTSKNFEALMDNKGIEPRLEGHTDEEGFKWVCDSFEKCLQKAEQCGVVLGLENHWGLGRTAEGVLKIVNTLDSPWLRVTMDSGNFFERRHEQLKMLAPKAVFMQAKTYYGGGVYYDLPEMSDDKISADYAKVARICQDANFKGYISLEFEGKEDPWTAVPKSLAMLRTAFGKKQEIPVAKEATDKSRS